MKRSTPRLFLVLIVFSGFVLTAKAPSLSAAEVLERILAVVNDEIVTERDLQILLAPVAAQYRTLHTGKELEDKLAAARRDFLNKVIEDKLILSEAKRKKVIVKDEEVDEMITEIRNKFPAKETFLNAIESQGLTEKKLWNRFYDQLMTQKLVNYEVRSRVFVSPGEIAEYYKTHGQDFAQGDRARLQQILVRIGSRSEEDAKAFAETLVSRIRGGASFEELAKSYSEGAEAKEGGEMGWVEKGQLLGEIDQKVFEQDAGQVTEPVKTSLGYHVFKVVERQRFSVKPLTEVKDQIQDLIFKKKMRERLESWVASLRKNAYISIR
ncbi:MAG: peptidylprolyl isomerase [Candidatus Omnitrophica bacterium]|nr:peptidylprolyl isomerase [Candidatus Omnitrophota bacterium]